jgi:hypothetical protein
MMARSQRSKQKPDTLMQDRPPPTRRNLLATHGSSGLQRDPAAFAKKAVEENELQSADVIRTSER